MLGTVKMALAHDLGYTGVRCLALRPGVSALNKKARTRLLIATGVIVAVFVVVVVVLVQKQGAYYRQVSQLTTGKYDGKHVQVGGKVLGGTINRDTQGNVHFTMQDLTGKTDTVKVVYKGEMPSTFASGVDVVVAGTMAADGIIDASQLQTKCPSKYKAQATTPTAQPSP
jgi:cytochrome c-type biogenesis protein CcmE